MVKKERWWTISESALSDALMEVWCGENPDNVMLELIANSDVEDYSGKEDDG